jgi:hypothetical protein
MDATYALPRRMRIDPAPLLSREAKKRLAWMDYYHECRKVSMTCRHFGISRKTFHQWKNRIDLWSFVVAVDKKASRNKGDALPPLRVGGGWRSIYS